MAASDRFAFVLFQPQSAGNIGAAARAIKNMGFSDLRIVERKPSGRHSAEIRRRAAAMAVHAGDVLDAAQTFPDLAAALSDCAIVVGTTCRPGLYRSSARPVREATMELAGESRSNRIALVFGREDHGLTNRELKLCHRLIVIPAAPEYPSLNLAQAVIVVAYELMMALDGRNSLRETDDFASAGEASAMIERFEEALLSIGFLLEDNPDHIMFALRSIFGRAGLLPRDVEILNGIARQIKWTADGGHLTIADKRRAGRKLR
ncbi:MAG TPA: RNA methyltransferase [Candidatus Binataceae bacterium]|nr:RNA methyltransferase [Candidatus Binataceae bacterium]